MCTHLHYEIEDGDGEEGKDGDFKSKTQYNEDRDGTHETHQPELEVHWQLRVYDVSLLRETIGHATGRRAIERRHWPAQDIGEEAEVGEGGSTNAAEDEGHRRRNHSDTCMRKKTKRGVSVCEKVVNG